MFRIARSYTAKKSQIEYPDDANEAGIAGVTIIIKKNTGYIPNTQQKALRDAIAAQVENRNGIESIRLSRQGK